MTTENLSRLSLGVSILTLVLVGVLLFRVPPRPVEPTDYGTEISSIQSSVDDANNRLNTIAGSVDTAAKSVGGLSDDVSGIDGQISTLRLSLSDLELAIARVCDALSNC